MGLEAVTFISDLVITNTVGATDPKSQGDDHIRNLKKALKNTFPSFVGAAITLTEAQINDAARKSVSNVFTSAQSIAVADNVSALKMLGATNGGLRFRTYVDATNGTMIEAVNASEAAFIKATINAQTLRFNTFATATNVDITLNGVAASDFARLSQSNTFTSSGAGPSTAAVNISAASPWVRWDETDQSANNKVWMAGAAGGAWVLGLDVDGGGTLTTTPIVVTRSGTTITSIALAGTAITLNGVAASDFARLSQNNTFTGSQQIISHATTAVFDTTINSVSAAYYNATTAGAFLYERRNLPLEFGSNNTARYTISAGGNHDFKSGTATFGGAATFNAALAVASAIRTTLGGDILNTGIISPAALSASQNDYAPSGHATASIIRLDPNGNTPASITGLAGGVNGRRVILMRIPTATGTIRFEQENASSSAANRFSNGASPITLNTTFESMEFFYDGTLSRWVPLGVQTA